MIYKNFRNTARNSAKAVRSSFEGPADTLVFLPTTSYDPGDFQNCTFANAGIAGEGGALAETTLAGWQRELDINLTGVYLTMREAARAMEPRGYGKIVSTASIYGLVGDAIEGGFAYAATKGAVVNLTRTAAVRLAPHGIRVNAIAPGYARTRIGDGILLADSPEAEELREEIRRRTPLGHLAEPDDLKGIAVFLASPASDYCTGFTYAVDGGWLAADGRFTPPGMAD